MDSKIMTTEEHFDAVRAQTIKYRIVKSKDIEIGDGRTASFDRWLPRDESFIDYGFFDKNGGKGIENHVQQGSFYITTAINYTNGPPHMGHAYEATTADAIARFDRLKNSGPTYFVTGADEHGQKIANTASSQGKKPIETCDQYVNGFKCLNQRILISNDDYIRTTSERHERTARELWLRCAEKGDIYLDTYSGWYNIREETFVSDSDAALSEYKDPVSGKPLKKVEEESYFFKMSSYKDKLIEHIENNPEFIRPQQHRNLILARLSSDDLRDLSISRTTFDWGVRVPDGFKQNHVMYVWVDALSNYLTGVDYFGKSEVQNPCELKAFWPANVHIIGKDILWFHTVIWPCLLMSAGLPLPKTVFAHGFVNDKEGKKMSKSLGNVVDPHEMLDKYPVDTFRWYLCKGAPYGGELSFSEASLHDMHNADLCDTLGNLVHRATNLCGKYCGGAVVDVGKPIRPPIDFAKLAEQYITKMQNYELESGASIAILGCREINRYLTEEAPWLKKGEDHREARQITVRATLEAIYAVTHLLVPFIPVGASAIFRKLNTPPVTLEELNHECRNLSPGTKIEVGEVLYSKLGGPGNDADKGKRNLEKAQKEKREKKAQSIAKSQAANPNQPAFTKLDIRVGKILKVWNHESAEKLFCEEIDVGEEEPRQIASGLRECYTLEEMKGKLVLVVCNLKPAKIVGFSSSGMVLAAKADGKIELVSPPENSRIGERVFVDGVEGEPFSAAQVKKKKIWEEVAKDLKTGIDGIAKWSEKDILTSVGPCKAASLVGAPIS